MNKIGILVAASLIAVTVSAPAFAEGYAQQQKNIYRGQLGDASKFFQANRQLQVLDPRPSINDLRRPDVAPDTYAFNLGPVPSQGGNTFVYSDGNPAAGNASPFRRGNPAVNLGGLAPIAEMHQSNIPNRSMVNTGSLPMGQNTGIHGPTGDAATGGHKATVSGRVNPGRQAMVAQAQEIKVYRSYTNPLGGSTFGAKQGVGEVTGILRTPVGKSPLINKILPKKQ